jgi:hypothetical protein
MKNNLLKYYIAAFYLCSTLMIYAQPGADDTTGNLESTDTPAPIDDYVWILALVGLILVFMKFRAMQSKKIKE